MEITRSKLKTELNAQFERIEILKNFVSTDGEKKLLEQWYLSLKALEKICSDRNRF